MRFISPSFTGNAFGLLDLNAVTYTTSPAYSLQSEHPTGEEYARYLQGVASLYQLPVASGLEIQKIEPVDGEGEPCSPDQNQGFLLETVQGTIHSRFVIWAAGEFQYPNLEIFPGSQQCLHNATVRDWADVPGDEFVIIGGYESGIDAAVNLVELGKKVRVLDDTAPWDLSSPDPSLVLSPYTMQRLRLAQASGRLELVMAGVESVEPMANGSYAITLLDDQGILNSETKPILATGFTGSLDQITHLLNWHPQSYHALLTQEDESERTPGLFLSGPFVRHDHIIFCFIYKFRQRFAVIAQAIGQRLGLDTSALEAYRQHQMFLDDLSCCEDDCAVC